MGTENDIGSAVSEILWYRHKDTIKQFLLLLHAWVFVCAVIEILMNIPTFGYPKSSFFRET